MSSSSITRAPRATALIALCAALWLAAPAARAQAQRGPAEGLTWGGVEVEFTGTRFSQRHLKEALRRAVGHHFDAQLLRSGRGRHREPFDMELLERLLRQNVVGVMRESGYVRARLGELRQHRRGRMLVVTAPIEEGEFYRLGEVRVAGASHFTAEQLREYLPFRRGDVADEPGVRRWLGEHLKRIYADAGFIRYAYELAPHYTSAPATGEYVVNYDVLVKEGLQFRVRRIVFEGNSRVPEETLRDALGIREGEVFGEQKLRDGIRELEDLDDRREVDVDVEVAFKADESAGELEIIVSVTEEAKPGGWYPPRGEQ